MKEEFLVSDSVARQWFYVLNEKFINKPKSDSKKQRDRNCEKKFEYWCKKTTKKKNSEDMILRSRFRRKLSYHDKSLSSPLIEKYSTPVASIRQQKQTQESERVKVTMAENIKAFSKCCETAQGKVNRIRVAIETAEQDHTKFNIHALKLYLKTVDAAYEEYNDYQNQIYLADPSRKQEFEAKFIEFEELYEFARIAICQMIEQHEEEKKVIELASSQTSNNQPGSGAVDSMMRYPPTIVLQQSALPSFDGKYENWYKFKQMFRDIADNALLIRLPQNCTIWTKRSLAEHKVQLIRRSSGIMTTKEPGEV